MAEFTLFYRKHSASNQRNNRVYRRGHLFNYLTITQGLAPSDDAIPPVLKSTANTLEVGINAVIKDLARARQGLSAEHRRTVDAYRPARGRTPPPWEHRLPPMAARFHI